MNLSKSHEKNPKMGPVSIVTTQVIGKTHRKVTNLHMDYHLFSGVTASNVYLCFCSVKINLFTSLNVHDCMLDFMCSCVCV